RTALSRWDHRSLHHDPALRDDARAGTRRRDRAQVLARRHLRARQSRRRDRLVRIGRFPDRSCGACYPGSSSRARSDFHLLLRGSDLRALSAADRVFRHRSDVADRFGRTVRDRRPDRRHRDGHRCARLQQFRQYDHVRAARADPCLRHCAQRGPRRVRAGAPPALVSVMTARARVFDHVFLVAGLWLAWVLVFQWAGPEALSPPGATLQRIGEYLTSAQFWPHAAATGLAFAYACLAAVTGGLVLGLALGANRLAGEIGEPILSSLYSIPKITLYPVILLVFGLGVSAKVAFGALHGIFPVALFAIGALRNTSPALIKTARVL